MLQQVCVCNIYIYIYIHIYIHTHIHTHTLMHAHIYKYMYIHFYTCTNWTHTVYILYTGCGRNNTLPLLLSQPLCIHICAHLISIYSKQRLTYGKGTTERVAQGSALIQFPYKVKEVHQSPSLNFLPLPSLPKVLVASYSHHQLVASRSVYKLVVVYPIST